MNVKQMVFYRDMENATFKKFTSLIEKVREHDWIRYHIDKHDCFCDFDIQIDFRTICFMLDGLGHVYVTLSNDEDMRLNSKVTIKLTEAVFGCDVEPRGVEEIINDFDTLINIFFGDEFYKYLSELIEYSKDKYYLLGYREWYEVHCCF